MDNMNARLVLEEKSESQVCNVDKYNCKMQTMLVRRELVMETYEYQFGDVNFYRGQ